MVNLRERQLWIVTEIILSSISIILFFPSPIFSKVYSYNLKKKNQSNVHLIMYLSNRFNVLLCFIRSIKQFWKIINNARKYKHFFLLCFQRAECHFKVSYTKGVTT